MSLLNIGLYFTRMSLASRSLLIGGVLALSYLMLKRDPTTKKSKLAYAYEQLAGGSKRHSTPRLETSKLLLTSLPPEVLTEVLKNVGWRDVLSIRRTCKFLDNISRAKLIWKHFLELQAQEQAVPCSGLEKPVELFSSRELERIFLRWISVEVALNTEARKPIREETLEISLDIRDVYMLRGGRWALFRDAHGNVYYCDLEALAPSLTLLLPCPFTSAGFAFGLTAVDESLETPLLSFRVATFVEALDKDWQLAKEDLRPRIDIYQVNLVLDSHNQAVGFSSTSLCTFRPDNLGGEVKFLDFRGPYLAAAVDLDTVFGDYCAVIFDWERLNQQHQAVVRRNILSLGSPIYTFRLLPNSTIVLGCALRLCVHELSAFAETTDLPDDLGSTPPPPLLYEFNIDAASRLRFSKVLSSADNFRLVFQVSGVVLGLSCAKNSSTYHIDTLFHYPHPVAVDELSQPPDFSNNLGAAWSLELSAPVFVRFSWPHEVGVPRQGVTCCDTSNRWSADRNLFYLDASSGRLIYVDSPEIYIAQFACLC